MLGERLPSTKQQVLQKQVLQMVEQSCAKRSQTLTSVIVSADIILLDDYLALWTHRRKLHFARNVAITWPAKGVVISIRPKTKKDLEN